MLAGSIGPLRNRIAETTGPDARSARRSTPRDGSHGVTSDAESWLRAPHSEAHDDGAVHIGLDTHGKLWSECDSLVRVVSDGAHTCDPGARDAPLQGADEPQGSRIPKIWSEPSITPRSGVDTRFRHTSGRSVHGASSPRGRRDRNPSRQEQWRSGDEWWAGRSARRGPPRTIDTLRCPIDREPSHPSLGRHPLPLS